MTKFKKKPVVLITGASGFIGKKLCEVLVLENYKITAVSRSSNDFFDNNKIRLIKADLVNDSLERLPVADCIVHLAGLAHLPKKHPRNNVNEYRKVNVSATLKLAKWAIKNNVKRFVFVSTVGVYGKSNKGCITEKTDPNPDEPYAISKYEAELMLKNVFDGSAVELVIIRPPLVYSIDAPGTFGCLVGFVSNFNLFPVAAKGTYKSLISITNLIGVIIECINNYEAKGCCFLVSDGKVVSLRKIVECISCFKKKKLYVIKIPYSILLLIGAVFGKKNIIEKLYGNQIIDSSECERVLGWKPVKGFIGGFEKE